MSIKIYDGKRYSGGDIFDLQKLLVDYKTSMAPLVQDQVGKHIGRIIADRHDRYLLGMEKNEPDLDIWSVWKEVEQKYKEAQMSMQRDVENDYFAQVFIYPIEGVFLMRCVAERRFFTDAFDMIKEFEDWGYWDNTDQPSEITDAEWDERERLWCTAIDLEPYRFHIVETYQLPVDIFKIMQPEKFAEYYPSIRERAMTYGREKAVSEFIARHSVMPSMGEISGFIFSDECKKRSREIADEIQDQLTDIEFFKKLVE